jgi:hypothetical protein
MISGIGMPIAHKIMLFMLHLFQFLLSGFFYNSTSTLNVTACAFDGVACGQTKACEGNQSQR